MNEIVFKNFTEIVDSVKSREKCLRPSVADLSCDEEVGVLMKRCWTEDPADRPDFTTLKAVIRKLNK